MAQFVCTINGRGNDYKTQQPVIFMKPARCEATEKQLGTVPVKTKKAIVDGELVKVAVVNGKTVVVADDTTLSGAIRNIKVPAGAVPNGLFTDFLVEGEIESDGDTCWMRNARISVISQADEPISDPFAPPLA
ncbi:hypothetical protein UFOVP1138_51 [uncultured Caudovirales phage]|uniref:Uncharacterized protein n=1 Tax=uncultured Caudovirales phage TaxID=2100421 RepID=A0A6J5S7A7_9CAUD|nr:hypothetical protein UFOVP975_69 [uncultured Caudovirales phage]CAB4186271.1 hypothetical protein UFOVP1138_51 [uncultured Caudovirales phage]CAB4204428.1 hypothetical protein UFOVP1394_48 [uncultured Caudovirales phage]